MLFENINQMLEPGYTDFETGWKTLPNGQGYVAALTRMPRIKGRVVDWWFGWCGDTEKYKLWHPKAHVVGDWANWSPGCYIGATHLVHEYLGDEIAKLRISFFDPSEIFDVSRFREANVAVAVCGRIGLQEPDLDTGYLVHFVRDTDYGCEMRSRFWFFKQDESLCRMLLQHCIEEMGYLADLLPDLYAREGAR